MKKIILLALCLVVVSMYTVDDTFAMEVGQTVEGLFHTVKEWFGDVTAAAPTPGSNFEVAFYYPDSDGTQSAPVLIPGKTISRRIAAENKSTENDAYFCVAFAVDETIADDLHFTKQSGYEWKENYNSITLNGTAYRLSVAICTSQLDKQDISEDVISAISLDADVRTEQISNVSSDFLKMKLMAVDVETFASVENATAQTVLTKALDLNNPDFNPFAAN